MISYEDWLNEVRLKHGLEIEHQAVLYELNDILGEKLKELIRKQFGNYDIALILETMDLVKDAMAEKEKENKFESEGIAQETKSKRGRKKKTKDLN